MFEISGGAPSSAATGAPPPPAAGVPLPFPTRTPSPKAATSAITPPTRSQGPPATPEVARSAPQEGQKRPEPRAPQRGHLVSIGFDIGGPLGVRNGRDSEIARLATGEEIWQYSISSSPENLMFASSFSRPLALIALLAIGACTKTEYVERDPVNPPPDAASGFVGYYDNDTKLTTCGNCHANTQSQWINTKHASAWSVLPVPQGANCVGCHAVTPDVGTPPLPKIGQNDPGASCVSCHSGAHQPFAEQWAASGHNDSAGMASPASNPSCTGCHEGRAAIVRFNGGQTTRYSDSVGTKTILCVVCHDPHGSAFPHQLPGPIDSPDPSVNLC